MFWSISGDQCRFTSDADLPPPLLSSSSTYPEITSDAERHDYKREFDADLREYKRLCAEMDDINDQLNKLSRQLDTLDETSAKYQVRYTQNSPAKLTRKTKPNKHPGNESKLSLNFKSGTRKGAQIMEMNK